MYCKGLPDWKGEYYVDTRNDKVRDIMKTRLQLAKEKGCDGVDPDNVDAYDTPSGFPLTAETQLDYNKFLADAAHALNLSVGLKSDITQTPSLVDYFDFAVNEQCIDMKTCDQVKPFVANHKPVFGVEYKGDRVAGSSGTAAETISPQRRDDASSTANGSISHHGAQRRDDANSTANGSISHQGDHESVKPGHDARKWRDQLA